MKPEDHEELISGIELSVFNFQTIPLLLDGKDVVAMARTGDYSSIKGF